MRAFVRRDEAIHLFDACIKRKMDCFAPLAMTAWRLPLGKGQGF
jgi:hypothetical protein